MNKIVYIGIIIIFIIAIIGAGFLVSKQKEAIIIKPTCIPKDNTCCKGDICSMSNVTCEIGSEPQFKGCDADCQPIVECIKTE